MNPGLVLYAMADGGFAVWDSARNAWKQRGGTDEQDKIKAYVFSGQEVWQGLPNSDPRMGWLCNGLVRDWANWQREDSEPFQQLKNVLRTLSPNPRQPLEPGKRVRLRVVILRIIPPLSAHGTRHQYRWCMGLLRVAAHLGPVLSVGVGLARTPVGQRVTGQGSSPPSRLSDRRGGGPSPSLLATPHRAVVVEGVVRAQPVDKCTDVPGDPFPPGDGIGGTAF